MAKVRNFFSRIATAVFIAAIMAVSIASVGGDGKASAQTSDTQFPIGQVREFYYAFDYYPTMSEDDIIDLQISMQISILNITYDHIKRDDFYSDLTDGRLSDLGEDCIVVIDVKQVGVDIDTLEEVFTQLKENGCITVLVSYEDCTYTFSDEILDIYVNDHKLATLYNFIARSLRTFNFNNPDWKTAPDFTDSALPWSVYLIDSYLVSPDSAKSGFVSACYDSLFMQKFADVLIYYIGKPNITDYYTLELYLKNSTSMKILVYYYDNIFIDLLTGQEIEMNDVESMLKGWGILSSYTYNYICSFSFSRLTDGFRTYLRARSDIYMNFVFEVDEIEYGPGGIHIITYQQMMDGGPWAVPFNAPLWFESEYNEAYYELKNKLQALVA